MSCPVCHVLYGMSWMPCRGCHGMYVASYMSCLVYHVIRGWSTWRMFSHAYDARVELYHWYGCLSFSVSEASAVDKALVTFLDILQQISDDRNNTDIVTPETLTTAKADVVYPIYSKRSDATSAIRSSIVSKFAVSESFVTHSKATSTVDVPSHFVRGLTMTF
eukprot:GFYU01011584.1.p1 GENE.GFYU01011584.1~~GFYU01011584.1.p1  ORF type:complete len:163 (+),score=26.31 GFYU01011584.1:840-1328(+)